MTFRVGQKVVCVNVHESWGGSTYHLPQVGEVYTVRSVSDPYGPYCNINEPCIRVLELKNRPAPCGEEPNFLASRFRPLVERKTDISVFTEILHKATKPARTPAMSQQDRQT